jgi:predicted AAA+ superfamily ATPase
MFRRLIQPLPSQSFFLFGARGTGKSTFLRQFFDDQPDVLWIDLLNPEQEEAYSLDPRRLERLVLARQPQPGWVVLDEIQKVPRLLDSVHRLIESTRVRFALTGSSARKLKAGKANMLAGRAYWNNLFPLTWQELGGSFDLDSCLRWGSLPRVVTLGSELERAEYLRTYSQVYLKEEVWAEQLVRKLDGFRKFLPIAAQMNGQIVVASRIARDTGCDLKTVQSYFQILEDTLVGFMLEAYETSLRKSVSGKPKFYFFDIGVQRALARLLHLPPTPQTSLYGETFEHFLILECYRLNAYHRTDYHLYHLKTKDGVEIDLILERPGEPLILIEIKSTRSIRPEKLRRFLHLSRDFSGARCFCFSQDETPQRIEHVSALHWTEGLRELFSVP